MIFHLLYPRCVLLLTRRWPFSTLEDFSWSTYMTVVHKLHSTMLVFQILSYNSFDMKNTGHLPKHALYCEERLLPGGRGAEASSETSLAFCFDTPPSTPGPASTLR